MTTLTTISNNLTRSLPELKSKYRIKSIGIFGSYVRNEQNDNSDIDILVEFDENSKTTMFSFIRLQNDLNQLLGLKVDLVTKKALKPNIGKSILAEVVYFN